MTLYLLLSGWGILNYSDISIIYNCDGSLQSKYTNTYQFLAQHNHMTIMCKLIQLEFLVGREFKARKGNIRK